MNDCSDFLRTIEKIRIVAIINRAKPLQALRKIAANKKGSTNNALGDRDKPRWIVLIRNHFGTDHFHAAMKQFNLWMRSKVFRANSQMTWQIFIVRIEKSEII